MRSTRSKPSSNPVNNQANDEHTPRNIRGWYGDNTYCSLMAPEIAPFLQRRSTCTTSRADALLQNLESQQDRYWNDLKQQAKELRSKHGTAQNVHIWYDTYYCRRPPPTALDYVMANGTGALPARGTKGRVTTGRRRLNWLCDSTSSIGMSSQPEEITAGSLVPMNYQKIFKCPEPSQNNMRYCHKVDAQPMEDLFPRLGTSSQDVTRPTSNSFPEPPGTKTTASPGWAAGSPQEPNTKTQKLNDAIFLYRRALDTSLWKLWMATVIFLWKKLTKMKNED